jgi:hypothetical protein
MEDKSKLKCSVCDRVIDKITSCNFCRIVQLDIEKEGMKKATREWLSKTEDGSLNIDKVYDRGLLDEMLNFE